jgi:CheY-like chemotaxis protein
VIDLMMPDMDGLTVLRRRREAGLARAARVIVLTANSDPVVLAQCHELGADDIVLKPVDPERLLAAVAATVSDR